jgi:hypothetical protein
MTDPFVLYLFQDILLICQRHKQNEEAVFRSQAVPLFEQYDFEQSLGVAGLEPVAWFRPVDRAHDLAQCNDTATGLSIGRLKLPFAMEVL